MMEHTDNKKRSDSNQNALPMQLHRHHLGFILPQVGSEGKGYFPKKGSARKNSFDHPLFAAGGRVDPALQMAAGLKIM